MYIHVSILHVTDIYYVSILYMSAPLICHTIWHSMYGPAYKNLSNNIYESDGMFFFLKIICWHLSKVTMRVYASVCKYPFLYTILKHIQKLLHYADESRNDYSISYNVMAMTCNDMNMKTTFPEHSHSSGSPYLHHVVVMCPPPQHVHTEMPLSVQSPHSVINMWYISSNYNKYTRRNSDDDYVNGQAFSCSYNSDVQYMCRKALIVQII